MKYPLIVRGLQVFGAFIIGWHLRVLGPAALLLTGMWVVLVEICWDTRFPW
jgi:hypothetical protein